VSEVRNNKKPNANLGQVAGSLQLSRRLETQVNGRIDSAAPFSRAARRLGTGSDSVSVVQSILANGARFLGLERHSPHWAWGLNGETTPWYPSLKIFRQSKRRDWSGAIEMPTTELSEKFASSSKAANAPNSEVANAGNAERYTQLLKLASKHNANERQAAQALARF
jgi:hypothetical protein